MFESLQIADLWIVFCSIAVYQLILQYRSSGRLRYDEGTPKLLQVLTGMPALLVLIIFLADPDLPHAKPFTMTAGIDLAGLLIFNVAALLVLWSHITLGDCWSGDLETKSDHRLVDKGLYRFIRHPLYSSYMLLAIGLFLLSDNWWVGLSTLVYFIAVAARTWREEAMMVERLGDPYRDYQGRTGRFVPRLPAVWSALSGASRPLSTLPTDSRP